MKRILVFILCVLFPCLSHAYTGDFKIDDLDSSSGLTSTDKVIISVGGVYYAATQDQIRSFIFTGGVDFPYEPLEIIIGDGTNVITAGTKGIIEVSQASTITSAELVCDQTGSIVVDIWKTAHATTLPTVTNTITASAKPTLSSAQYVNTTITGWTTRAIAAGDFIRFNVEATPASVTRCTLILQRGAPTP